MLERLWIDQFQQQMPLNALLCIALHCIASYRNASFVNSPSWIPFEQCTNIESIYASALDMQLCLLILCKRYHSSVNSVHNIHNLYIYKCISVNKNEKQNVYTHFYLSCTFSMCDAKPHLYAACGLHFYVSLSLSLGIVTLFGFNLCARACLWSLFFRRRVHR